MGEESTSHFLELIEELVERVRTLEERLEHTWDGCRPHKTGGREVPENEEVAKSLAFDLKSVRSAVTDIIMLHTVDTTLHLLSMWPVLPQESRHYAYNMAKLLHVSITEGWNEAVQQSNGFTLQLIATPNGQQSPVRRALPAVNSDRVKIEPLQNVTNSVQAVPEASTNTEATPQAMDTEPGTSMRRQLTDDIPITTPKKVARNINPTSPGSGTITGTPSPFSYKPKCSCKQPAFRLQVKKDNQNCGRYFYKCWKCCINNPNNPCSYFQWEDELPVKAPKCCGLCGKPGHNRSNCPAK